MNCADTVMAAPKVNRNRITRGQSFDERLERESARGRLANSGKSVEIVDGGGLHPANVGEGKVAMDRGVVTSLMLSSTT